MSLTRPAKGRSRRRGRISYAQLGINQLGAVYEALLSYRGFFAEEDLYEVKQAGKDPDELENAWFVPLSELHKYSQDERVFEAGADGLRKLKVHPKGRFIYRLAGRDREKTASYYTPESLTRCVVKYALKELIPDDMPASRILELTICEPAMGSAAFLNEAVNQLAEKYLDRRQRELGRRIPHADYADEFQKVKHFITDRNVFGVDLNPVAVELAEVSLWLNCIHKDGHVPWFGFQLVCGNSLVGARRQVYASGKLGEEVRRGDRWFNFAPEPGDEMPGPGTVYHFLLPDPGMADYCNKAAMRYEPANFARIKAWRKAFCRPFTAEEIAELEALSARVDELWALHTEQLARDRRETEDTLPVWGPEGSTRPGGPPTTGRTTFATRACSAWARARSAPTVAEAGDGLLVCAVVLAHRRGGTTADQGRVPERGQPGAEGLGVPAGSGAEPDRGPVRPGVRRARRRDCQAHHQRNRDAGPGQAVRAVPAPEVRGRDGGTAAVPSLGAGVRGLVPWEER